MLVDVRTTGRVGPRRAARPRRGRQGRRPRRVADLSRRRRQRRASSTSCEPRALDRGRARSTCSAAPACAAWPRPRRRPAAGSARRTTCSRGSRGRTTRAATARSSGWKVAGLPWRAGMSDATPTERLAARHPRRARWPAAAAASTRRPRRSTSPPASSTSAAEDAEAAFKGDVERYVYSRYGNPTVTTFEERLRLIEGAEACFATAIRDGGGLHRAGGAARPGRPRRVVAGACSARASSSSTRSCRAGGSRPSSSTAPTSTSGGRPCPSRPTAVFFETPSNPMQELVDIAAVTRAGPRGRRAGRRRQRLRHAGVLATPLELGADIVVYSATKHIDGQGRTLGGAVLGPSEFIDGPVQNLMRHTGPSMSPVQRLGADQGARDAVAAGRADGRQRPRGRRAASRQHPQGHARSRYPFLDSPPAARAGQARRCRPAARS